MQAGYTIELKENADPTSIISLQIGFNPYCNKGFTWHHGACAYRMVLRQLREVREYFRR